MWLNYLWGGVILLLPVSISRIIINRLPNRHIGKHVKIGFSLILASKFDISDYCSIGHLNIISNNSLYMGPNAKIRHLNRISGNFDMSMGNGSSLNSQNKVTGRHRNQISYQTPKFILEDKVSIIMGHQFDLNDSITIRKGTVFAGTGSQIWTHSFFVGTERNVRIDGPVEIGEKCYIGARSVICAGVSISNMVSVGANTTVSKSLLESGLYVSQPLRYIPFDADEAIAQLGLPIDGYNAYRKYNKKHNNQ